MADYPAGYAEKPSSSWFKLGYLIGYVTDVLQNLEALAGLGCAADVRVALALEWLLGKQDAQGQWKLEYTYNGKTWADVEKKCAPANGSPCGRCACYVRRIGQGDPRTQPSSL